VLNYEYNIQRKTHDDIKTRVDLAKHFAERGYKIGAEIGVAEGEYAVELCKNIPGLKYYGIDAWPREGKIQHHIQARYELTKKRLAPYDATLIRKTSMEAVKDFENSSLDFVYIDADHKFDYAVNDIIEWTKKVRKGGIVSGHDYILRRGCGVVLAVDGFVHSHLYRLNLTTDDNETISWWFEKFWNS
jgi:predicted O-methyltransferase YrrM